VVAADGRRDVQFGCYLTADEAVRLTRYAESLQINRPNLGILLIVRELKCRRLQELARWEGSPVTKTNGVRVTARGNYSETKDRFRQQASSIGLGMDEAVAMLFRSELEECWLEQSLAFPGNRP